MSIKAAALVGKAQERLESLMDAANDLDETLEGLEALANGPDELILEALIRAKGVTWILRHSSNYLHEQSHVLDTSRSREGMRHNAGILNLAADRIRLA
jgi:hypothetical protein